MMHAWGSGWGMGWGMGPVGGVLMLLFWLAVVAFVVWLIVTLTRGSGRAGASALEILKQRYARGEIDKDEYERRKQDLLD